MNCQEAELWLVESARGGATRAGTDADALRHLDACPRCAARLHAEQAITEDLRAVILQDAHRAAPAHVEANLLVALRTQAEQRANTPARVVLVKPARTLPSLFFSRRALAAFAVGALVLLAAAALRFGFTAVPQRQMETATADAPTRPDMAATQPQNSNGLPIKQQNETAQPRPATTGTTAAMFAPRPVGLLSKPARRGHTMRPVREQEQMVGSVGEMLIVARAPAAAESVTEFMPLVAGSAPPMTSGRLVRVEVSRSALASLGLPVDMTRAGETVKADVLLGEDGLARAIRLVR